MIKRKEAKTGQSTSLQMPNTFGSLGFLLRGVESESITFFEDKRKDFCELVWKGIKSGLKIYVPDPKENTLLEAKGQSRSYIWQALRQTNKKNTSCAFNTAYWQKQNSPLSNNKENYLAFQNTHVLKSL